VTRAVYVGAAGDINLRLADDTGSQLLKAVAVGTMLPPRVTLGAGATSAT
jgi:hypothetical protein